MATIQVIEFDMRGQLCPSTLLTALREINTHKPRLRDCSVKLQFRTDNRDSTVTIPDAVATMGYGVRVSKDQDHYLIMVENVR